MFIAGLHSLFVNMIVVHCGATLCIINMIFRFMLKRGINVLAELDVPVHVVSCNKDDVKQVELHSESLIQSTAPRSAGFGGTRYATNIISSSSLAASIITTIGEEHLAALGASQLQIRHN
ncbi:hypothetical protein L2E82_28829 [Cichorium intybus]|uniref:Uncharacterized protein n=1 Tax=Cichorium intybus TaxID=13427 RepID=A0ACB9CX07_CICIN|nr:hypothetical protein L2E82_28829 [Cichorium intybus]